MARSIIVAFVYQDLLNFSGEWFFHFPFVIFHFSLADSTWKCNRVLFEKHFIRGPVTERLARPVI
jgi:hypothetical protein